MIEIITNKFYGKQPITERSSDVWPAIMNATRHKQAEKLFKDMGHIAHSSVELPNFGGAKGRVFIKDESGFLGLGSFKGRGAIWAMANVLAEKFGHNGIELEKLLSTAHNEKKFLFVTATDGNHGLAVAWAAKFFGQLAHIFLPVACESYIREEIENFGVYTHICNGNYDAAVKFASIFARKNEGILLQDTSWKGYEKIPACIMEGYGTLTDEIFALSPNLWPDYVLLQIGVGSFAASMVINFLAKAKKENLSLPTFIGLEPETAACFYHSLDIGDGKSHVVEGDLKTCMNGLSCGAVSNIAWPVLRANLRYSCSCADEVAQRGMEILKKDYGINSGASGAIGAGFLSLVNQQHNLADKINMDKKILLISTEKNFALTGNKRER